MTDFDFGDVLLVPFPFTNQSTAKQRPAVVVSSAAYQAAKPDLIMAITSQMHQARSTLEAPIIDWKAAGLLKASLLKPVIATIEKSLVIKKIGALAGGDRAAMRDILGAILGP